MTRPLNILVSFFALAAAIASAVGAFAQARPGSYRRVDDWARLPAGYHWGTMSAVAVDAHGNVYGFQRDDPTSEVIVFNRQGTYLRTWGQGLFPYPHGMRALRDGNIWTTDRQAQLVQKFSPDGTLLFSLGRKGVAGTMESTDTFNGASDVALAENGDIFVSDGEGQNTRIVKFSRDGRFLKSWGTKGAAPGQLQTPHAIFIDDRGQVWVADRGNKRLQVFDQEGRFLEEMSQFGTPVSLFIQGDQLYVASPAPENTVTIGRTDGTVVETIEGLDAPHGIAVDADGAIYVAQSGGKSILKFVKR